MKVSPQESESVPVLVLDLQQDQAYIGAALFNLAMNFIMEPASRKVGNFSGQYQDYRSRLRWRRCVVYRYI